MRDFTWKCGASVLVDDAYSEWEEKAPTLDSALDKAYKHLFESNVLDTGSLDIAMDTKELAKALGDLASGDNDDWEPVELMNDLEECKDKRELICTLEWIVSNANKEGRL